MNIPNEFLIPLLAFVAVIAIGSAVRVAKKSRRQQLELRLLDDNVFADENADEEESQPSDKGPLDLVRRVGGLVSPRGPSTRLANHLAQAGYYNRSAPTIYLGAKAILFFLGLGLTGLLTANLEAPATTKLLWVICGAAMFSFIPNVFVRARRQKRCKDARCHLPDAVDLLEICVSAGMGLDMAWNSVSDEIRRVSSVLADEMSLTNLEMQLGAGRADAMRNMAQRTGVGELSSLVSVLLQSERFGASIQDALRTFAESMREQRSQHAQESAERSAVKLLFPMIIFIFPAMIVVAAGPAGLKIAETLFT